TLAVGAGPAREAAFVTGRDHLYVRERLALAFDLFFDLAFDLPDGDRLQGRIDGRGERSGADGNGLGFALARLAAVVLGVEAQFVAGDELDRVGGARGQVRDRVFTAGVGGRITAAESALGGHPDAGERRAAGGVGDAPADLATGKERRVDVRGYRFGAHRDG